MTADTRYIQKVFDPAEWIETAEALREAASPFASVLNDVLLAWAQENPTENPRALYKKVHVFYMLWAYCFENLLKALIVTRQSAGDIGERKTLQLPEVLKSHNLENLARKAGIEHVIRDYPDVFGKLTACSIWFGRYPVPLRANDLDKDNVDIRSITNVHTRDLEVIYASIRSALDQSLSRKT